MTSRVRLSKSFTGSAKRFLVLLSLAGGLAAGTAWGGDFEACTSLSFAPLDHDIPACTRLLESGSLADDRRAEALLARAEALEVARTYKSGHTIDNAELLRRALADLDEAAALMRPAPGVDEGLRERILSKRASVSYQLGYSAKAVQDHTAVLEIIGENEPGVLFRRALAYKQMGKFDNAIADMDSVVEAANGSANHPNMIYQRGLIYEAAGKEDDAIADYRKTLKLDVSHIGATKALERLGASR